MKAPKDAYGLNLKVNGPYPCKGSALNMELPTAKHLNTEQEAWMKANKPLYYTGKLLSDLPHLPQHLRHI